METKHLIISFVLIHSFLCFSQNNPKLKISNGDYEIYPIGFVVHEGISYTHGINSTVLFQNNNIQINYGLAGVVFRKLDSRYTNFDNKVKFPKLLNFDFNVGYKILNLVSSKSELKQKELIILGGYNFLRYGTSSIDYWIRDSIIGKGYERINGYAMDCATIGFKYHSTKTDESKSLFNFVQRHSISLSYILNVHNKLKINYDDLKVDSKYSNYQTQMHGVKFNYTYTHRLKGKFGISLGTEVFYTPTIKYAPNPKFYVPRGGEKINPLFVTLKLGLRITE